MCMNCPVGSLEGLGRSTPDNSAACCAAGAGQAAPDRPPPPGRHTLLSLIRRGGIRLKSSATGAGPQDALREVLDATGARTCAGQVRLPKGIQCRPVYRSRTAATLQVSRVSRPYNWSATPGSIALIYGSQPSTLCSTQRLPVPGGVSQYLRKDPGAFRGPDQRRQDQMPDPWLSREGQDLGLQPRRRATTLGAWAPALAPRGWRPGAAY